MTRATTITALALLLATSSSAQQPAPAAAPIGIPVPPLGTGPFVFDTAEQHKLRVVVVTKELSHPWSLVFLPDGSMLVSERAGTMRIVRNGRIDPEPVKGLPKVHAVRLSGLMDIALHPRFAENKLVYFTYSKPREDGMVATALARGKFDGKAFSEVRDILVADWWDGAGGSGSRIVFGKDGMLYMTTGASNGNAAQEPNSLRGKVLRLRDDGTAPSDNPFFGKAGYRPEIYSMGHRNQLGLIVHPVTGEVWSNENGPNGGDEINIIKPGRNYGWPIISYGRTYEGPRVSEIPGREGMEQPLIFWEPAIAVSGMAVYTGDRFPQWKNNVFVGGMRTGEIPGTGHLDRIVFNDKMENIRRESLLTELRQRIRDVRQGPDGYLYLLTDEDAGAILRLEPAAQ
jgi:glucose/arabinose dehydrogenase